MKHVFSADVFLSWHIFLEIASIVMAFSIFSITFYTFEQSKNLKSIIFACTFFVIGILDIFHFLTYKGMPMFLTAPSAQKATAFWVISRFTMAVAFLYASFLCPYRQTNKRRFAFFGVAIAYAVFWIYIINYHIDALPKLYVEGEGLTNLKIFIEYCIICIHGISIYMFFRSYKNRQEDRNYIFLIILGLIISACSELVFTLYISVYDIYNMVGHILKVMAYYLLFRALFVRNIEKPYVSLSQAENKLSAYADNLEKMVIKRTSEIQQAKNKLEQDLDYAKNIQLALLPNEFPNIPGMDFASRYFPCEKVGGDFYNVFKLDEKNLGIVIGDVAGHGVSAAMLNVFINQNIHVKKQYDDGRYKIFTPRGVLMNLYHVYNEMPFPEEAYLVMMYGIYNINTRKFSYASAGMNVTPIILSQNGDVRFIKADGFPICKFGKYFKPSYKTQSIDLFPGDTLIFYTDGLTDIDRYRPEVFGQENLKEFIKGMKGLSARETCDQLLDAYFTLLEDKDMLDDVTVLVVKTKEY
ncbi:MAG: SpoIIE family protein phosphatase [Xylanivirga thermophila]|uniref:MASE3 domain-containing protein n=1 Tax=Xylanivirga thermophila TaxID=2496273 RepID=UPI0013ED737E|nr:MASE3 domain-containing protein [Xylanivirga thermophila]